MLRKGNVVRLVQARGDKRVDIAALVTQEAPMVVKLQNGEAKMLETEGKRRIVEIRDPVTEETLMNALITKVVSSTELQLERMGQHELRRFIRVSTWLQFSHEPVDDARLEDEIGEISEPEEVDAGPSLPEMTKLQMHTLAQTDQASEAVLYLIEAVQAIDQKLDALALSIKQLGQRSRPAQFNRRRISLSGSGLRFDDESAYDKGALLKLRFKLPLRPMADITAIAEVIRVDRIVDQDTAESRYGVACRFTTIHETDREKIIAFTIVRQREILRRLRASIDSQ